MGGSGRPRKSETRHMDADDKNSDDPCGVAAGVRALRSARRRTGGPDQEPVRSGDDRRINAEPGKPRGQHRPFVALLPGRRDLNVAVRQLNVTLAAQLASFPLASSSGGFVTAWAPAARSCPPAPPLVRCSLNALSRLVASSSILDLRSRERTTARLTANRSSPIRPASGSSANTTTAVRRGPQQPVEHNRLQPHVRAGPASQHAARDHRDEDNRLLRELWRHSTVRRRRGGAHRERQHRCASGRRDSQFRSATPYTPTPLTGRRSRMTSKRGRELATGLGDTLRAGPNLYRTGTRRLPRRSTCACRPVTRTTPGHGRDASTAILRGVRQVRPFDAAREFRLHVLERRDQR